MSYSDVMRHQVAALTHWERGEQRQSADRYWEAYREIPNPIHEARFQMFRGYTSILQESYFAATDVDLENMGKVMSDKHEPRLYRVEAGYTLGMLHYARSERRECAEAYREAIRIGEKTPKAKQKRMDKKVVLFANLDGSIARKPMKEFMDEILIVVKSNLDQLNLTSREGGSVGPQLISNGTFKPPLRMSHHMPIGRGGTTLTLHEINNLIDIGGLHCDCCKQKRGDNVQLSACGRCQRAWYCSKECQVKSWKEKGHKEHCRKVGQFKPDDLVQLARLKSIPELNGAIVRFIGPDPNMDGRYGVRMEGAVEEDDNLSISQANLNQLRPYDCRK